MRGIAPFVALLLASASSWVNAVTVTGETPMTQFPGNGLSWTDTKTMNLVHPNGLHVVANKYFNWVRKQTGAYTGGNSGKNSLLVAVAYNPKTKKLAASTIPRGALLNAMKSDEAKTKAPVWSQVRERLIQNSMLQSNKDRMDAEDGAYYILEQSGGFKAEAGSLKYGDRTKENSVWISVWGTLHANFKQGPDMVQQSKTLPGDRVDLCSDGAAKQPDCTSLATNLGVYFEPVPAKSTQNNQGPAPRPSTPPPADNKRPASQSPPKSNDDKKKKKGGKRRGARRAAVPVEVEA